LIATLPARSAETPFSVLRVTRGNAVSYVVVETAKVTAEAMAQKRLAEFEIETWKAGRDAFLKQHRGLGLEYPDLSPLPALVSPVRSFLSQQTAQQIASTWQTEVDSRHALIRIAEYVEIQGRDKLSGATGTAGWQRRIQVESLPFGRLRERETAARRTWCQAMMFWHSSFRDRKSRTLYSAPPESYRTWDEYYTALDVLMSEGGLRPKPTCPKLRILDGNLRPLAAQVEASRQRQDEKDEKSARVKMAGMQLRRR